MKIDPDADPFAQKWCPSCARYRSVTEFGFRTASPDGLHYWCKDCGREKRQGKGASLRQQHVLNPMARARAEGASVVEEVDRRVVWGRDEGHCRRCRMFLPFDKMHMDHIIGLQRGGPHTYDNVQTLCEPCNHAKFSEDDQDHQAPFT